MKAHNDRAELMDKVPEVLCVTNPQGVLVEMPLLEVEVLEG